MTQSVTGLINFGIAALGTWPAFGLLMLLCCLLFGFLVPKAKAPIFAKAAPALPHKVLDEYFLTWTPDFAEKKFFADIGPEGRAAYRRFYLVMDFWFPGAAASLALASLTLIAFPSAGAWNFAIVAPSWLFDLAENVTHFRMAGSYPALSRNALRFGPSFTALKWIAAILPIPIAAAGIIVRCLS